MTVTVRLLQPHELGQAAAFIARLNPSSSDHIGYCGTVAKEILHTLTEDFGDVPASRAFVGAWHRGTLTGLLGFDADLGRGEAELWGPFTRPQSAGLSRELWHKLPLAPSIRSVQVFCNAQNVTCTRFAEQEGFIAELPTLILAAHRSSAEYKNGVTRPLTDAEHEDLITLHDELFPGTYYNGREIVERISDFRKILVISEGAALKGYVYVEVEPDFSDARIEFVGVKPQAKRKGVGTRLVQGALGWIFSFAEVSEVTLVVGENRVAARGLYQAAGFQIKHEMRSFYKAL